MIGTSASGKFTRTLADLFLQRLGDAERFEITTFTPSDLVKLVESTGFELLDLVGKTVLPMRHHRHLIETPEDRRTWAKVEKKLCRHPDAIGRAAHIQIACRRLDT